MRRKLIAGNWKSNGSLNSITVLSTALAKGVEGVDVAVFPPFVFLPVVHQRLAGSPVHIGAQNLSAYGPGAFTGEIAAEMLRDVACEWVLVGHSERRSLFGETEEMVSLKLARAFDVGLRPILCVGETLEQRNDGRAREVVLGQLETAGLRLLSPGRADITIAYEPVWAIGTGRSATPNEVQEVHGWIWEWLKEWKADASDFCRVLYGGSVTAANAKDILHCAGVDGALVGGASLNSVDFLSICRSAVEAANNY